MWIIVAISRPGSVPAPLAGGPRSLPDLLLGEAVQDQQDVAAGVAQQREVELVVEVAASGRHDQARMVLARARAREPALEIVARFSGGLGAALLSLAGRLDVALGRAECRGTAIFPRLVRRLVCWAPIGLLLADDHPLASCDLVRVRRIRGMEIDASSGNEDAPEWSTPPSGCCTGSAHGRLRLTIT